MEGCEICTLSPSIDGHLSHISIFLLTKVITKIKLILDTQFLFLPLGVKWKVVKDLHCPLLLINTGLMPVTYVGRNSTVTRGQLENQRLSKALPPLIQHKIAPFSDRQRNAIYIEDP